MSCSTRPGRREEKEEGKRKKPAVVPLISFHPLTTLLVAGLPSLSVKSGRRRIHVFEELPVKEKLFQSPEPRADSQFWQERAGGLA
jgi:hypothetical protein